MSNDDHDRLIRVAANWERMYGELSVKAQRLIAENAELRISIEGGCGCPAPYDTCPHDEPLLPALNKSRAENARLRTALQALYDADPHVPDGWQPEDWCHYCGVQNGWEHVEGCAWAAAGVVLGGGNS